MNRNIKIAVCVLAAFVSMPFLITKIVELRLRDPDRLLHEVGYSLPDSVKIIDSTASIWSLVDGPNYSWTVTADSTLLPRVRSVARWEYGQTYRAEQILTNGITETSYITVAPGEQLVTVETFRP